jgi:hypothetical protein
MVEDMWKRPLEVLNKAAIMKDNMKKKGFVTAKAKCPYCDGFWHGRLQGSKQHLHMKCDGNCGSMMME